MTDIPNPTTTGARGGFPSLGDAAYSGSPNLTGATFAARPPPPAQGSPGMRGSASRRVVGLVPAQAGADFPLVLRAPAKVRVDPREVSQTRADLRRAQQKARGTEAALLAAAGADLRNTSSPAYVEALTASRDANDLVAALTRKLADLEASSVSRPIRVTLARVREPAEVADVIGGDGVYVCMHDGCKTQRWNDEASMRRAHPSDAEMSRTQTCHPFAVLCESPLDPLDPEGEIVGLVATVGRDGTTIAHVRAVGEEQAERADDVEDLRAQNAEQGERLARLEKMIEELTGGTPKRAAKS